MPFKAPETDKCGKCQKSVYAAEMKLAGGKKYHKECFKCDSCNKFVDSTNACPHEDNLYCKMCHGKLHGPQGFNVGAGAGVKEIIKPTDA